MDVKVVAGDRARGAAALLKKWFKDTPLEDVDIPACRAYAKARQDGVLVSERRAAGSGPGRGGRAVSESTTRRELGVLGAAAGHAARWRRIGPKAKPPTPMPSIELPAAGAPRLVYLSKAELELAISTASGRLQDFILVDYYTAGRRRSVERLSRFQVDLRGWTINLTSPTETENERRSNKRRPVVPIDPKIRPLIERLYRASEAANSEWLWGDPKDMYREFNEHMVCLGLADKAFPHVLRHTRASHLLQDGVPLFHVARLLGDTVATVEKVYGHIAPDDLGAELEERA